MAFVQIFGKVTANVLGGEVAGDAFQMDYLSDTMKMTLHTDTWVPNIDTNEVKADATNELSTAAGYTSGGATLGTKTATYDSGSNTTTYGCANITWTASGGSIGPFRYAVLWDDTIASDPLVGYIDCGAQTITTGNTFTITASSGLFKVAA